MKVLASDKTYIDYFQGICSPNVGLSHLFGIRVREGFCSPIVKTGDGEARICGKEFRIPIRLEALPVQVRVIVHDHALNYPASDLMDVVTGVISFQQALNSLPKKEPQQAAAIKARKEETGT